MTSVAPSPRRDVGRAPLLATEPALLGLAATGAVGLGTVVLYARNGSSRFFDSDGGLYRYVALHPFSRGFPASVAHNFGNAYRFGRILYPLLASALGLGRPTPVRFFLVAINVLAAGVSVAAAAEICRRAGRPPLAGFAVLLAPGLLISLAIAVAEPMTVALTLMAYLCAIDRRWRAVLCCAVMLALTKEAAVVALLPLAWRNTRHLPRRALGWAATLLPLLAWWTWVRLRVGTWPFLDTAKERQGALALPLDGYVRVAARGLSADQLVGWIIGGLTLSLAAWVVVRHWSWPLAPGAGVCAAVLIVLGTEAVRIPGEYVRLMSQAQVLLVLCLVCGPVARWSETPSRPHG